MKDTTWQGLEDCQLNGLRGYPPPRLVDPETDDAKKVAWRAKCAAGARKRWAKVRRLRSSPPESDPEFGDVA